MAELRFVLSHMDSMRREAKVAAMLAVGAMAHETRMRCEDAISARDHSLADLAKMGHPYAKRAPANPHDPPETVHVQSGALVSGLTEDAPTANASGAFARVHNTEAELDARIQLGTPTMIARPYMAMVRRVFAAQIVEAGKRIMQARLRRTGT